MMDSGKVAFTSWLYAQCAAAEQIVKGRLDQGPLHFLQQSSSAGIGSFYERIDAWNAWTSGFVSGLRGRLTNGEHIVRDAERRFSDERLTCFRIERWRRAGEFVRDIDLRDRARFGGGVGFVELINSLDGMHFVPEWQQVRQTLLGDLRRFRGLLEGQIEELVLAQPSASSGDPDRVFMRMAIEEAKKSKSEDDRVHPMVGVVVVRNGQVLATAHRGELGPGDHGEYTALEKKLAGAALTDATAYVTLEPCTTRNHPKESCSERLLKRKIGRVVIGMVDPDHRITGRGIMKLRTGRVDVSLFPDDLAAEVEELNRHFQSSVEQAAKALATATASPATTDPGPRTVHIAINNSTVHGDVVGGDKKA